MRVSHLLSGTALVTTLAALMPGDAFAGAPIPTTIYIDESVEGTAPTVTSDLPSLTFTITDQKPAFGEEWTITFSIPTPMPIGGGEGGLTEPGSTKLSDVLIGSWSTTTTTTPSTTNFTFTLWSDDELGNILASCSAPGCLTQLEDGTFQSMFTIPTGFSPDISVLLKSDLDPLPEPGTIGLVASGLGALWWFRRRRRLA